jgi:hypothetical protein
MLNTFYIGGGNYWGEDGPNEKFNFEIVPELLKLGIKEKDLKKIANMFAEIYDIGYLNGSHNTECALNDY